MWQLTLTYDLDLRIRPIYGQGEPSWQISSTKVIQIKTTDLLDLIIYFQRYYDTHTLNAGLILLSWNSTTPTPTRASSRGSSSTRPTRDFLKLFLWQAQRHADILATILARMSARKSVSVSASWNDSWHLTNAPQNNWCLTVIK